MPTSLDHIVIGAATLVDGKLYVREQLGVDIPFGGQHTKMGTHNCLTRLGERTFLEVIAIDDKSDRPNRPRWFGLDDRRVQERLNKEPRLLTWVVNCDYIDTTLLQSQVSFG